MDISEMINLSEDIRHNVDYKVLPIESFEFAGVRFVKNNIKVISGGFYKSIKRTEHTDKVFLYNQDNATKSEQEEKARIEYKEAIKKELLAEMQLGLEKTSNDNIHIDDYTKKELIDKYPDIDFEECKNKSEMVEKINTTIKE